MQIAVKLWGNVLMCFFKISVVLIIKVPHCSKTANKFVFHCDIAAPCKIRSCFSIWNSYTKWKSQKLGSTEGVWIKWKLGVFLCTIPRSGYLFSGGGTWLNQIWVPPSPSLCQAPLVIIFVWIKQIRKDFPFLWSSTLIGPAVCWGWHYSMSQSIRLQTHTNTSHGPLIWVENRFLKIWICTGKFHKPAARKWDFPFIHLHFSTIAF